MKFKHADKRWPTHSLSLNDNNTNRRTLNNKFSTQSRNIGPRMKIAILLSCLSLVVATPEYVTRKLCKDVDVSQCTVHSVIVDPCAQGPAFCVVKKNKNYAVTLDMVPHFSASKLKLAISTDVDNNGNFSTPLRSPVNACGLLYCPLQAQERRIFDVNLILDKRASGKFPVKVKMWNEDNEAQACCVTFNVKVK